MPTGSRPPNEAYIRPAYSHLQHDSARCGVMNGVIRHRVLSAGTAKEAKYSCFGPKQLRNQILFGVLSFVFCLYASSSHIDKDSLSGDILAGVEVVLLRHCFSRLSRSAAVCSAGTEVRPI